MSAWRWRDVLLVSGLALATTPAQAGTDTGQLSVTATVQNGCHLDGGSLAFGTYTSGQATNLDVNGTIRFTGCVGTLTFALDNGINGGGSQRQMASGSARLVYQLYRNPARDAVFSSGSNSYVYQLFDSTPQTGQIAVYGRVPSGQIAPSGSYSDIVTITMTF